MVHRIVAAAMLVSIVACLAIWIRRDMQEYARFRQAGESGRPGFYRRWLWMSFAYFTLLALGGLLLLGRWRDILRMPPEFAGLVAGSAGVERAMASGEAVMGFLIGMVLAVVIGGVVATLLWSRLKVDASRVAGDFSALLPRTGVERRLALLMAANAGVGEELMFRLLLPLLLVLVGLPAWTAFALAAAAFGLAHLYQGWRGVLATTLLATGLTFLYLRSGQLWLAMLLHALIDVNAMIVRPWMDSRFTRRRSAAV